MSSKLKLWAGGVLLVGLLGLIGWQGYELYQAKNTIIENTEEKVKEIQGKVDQLVAEQKQKKDSDAATEEVKKDLKEQEKAVDKAKTEAEKYVEEKKKEIDAKYEKLEKNAINEERKRTEISLERMKGIWMTYCLQEPTSDPCKNTEGK